MILLILGCNSPSSKPEPPPQDSEVDTAVAPEDWHELSSWTPQNVVLIHVDTLRADRLPFYDSPRNTLPSLSSRHGWLSQQRHYASAPWTFPSTATLLTSLEPYQHGLTERPTDGSIAQVNGSFYPKWLQEQGVHTAFFDGNEDLMQTSLMEGWEQSAVDGTVIGSALSLEAAALSWIDSIPQEERFFVMLQPMDPHAPREPMEADVGTWVDYSKLPFSLDATDEEEEAQIQAVLDSGDPTAITNLKQGLEDLYDEELLGLDRGLETLLAGLESRDRLENTLVVLTADHGESLLDDGRSLGHGGSLREELIHIPLLFYNPRLEDRRVENCLSSNRSLLPTLTQSMGLELLPETMGAPFSGCETAVFSSLYRNKEDGLHWQVNVEADRMRAELDCDDGRLRVYNLETDPSANNPLAPGILDPSLLDQLNTYVSAVLTAHPDYLCNTNYH